MVSYMKKHNFSKNNNIIQSKMSQYEYKNLIKQMPFTIAYHDPSTTSHVRQSVLG